MKTKRERNKFEIRSVGLPRQMHAQAMARAKELDTTFSRYVQKLIAVDLERKIFTPGGINIKETVA